MWLISSCDVMFWTLKTTTICSELHAASTSHHSHGCSCEKIDWLTFTGEKVNKFDDYDPRSQVIKGASLSCDSKVDLLNLILNRLQRNCHVCKPLHSTLTE